MAGYAGTVDTHRGDPFAHGQAMNLGPLSDRTWPSMLRRMKRSDRTSVDTTPMRCRSTIISRLDALPAAVSGI